MECHFLLPQGVEAAGSVEVDGSPVSFQTGRVSDSSYADFSLDTASVRSVRIRY